MLLCFLSDPQTYGLGGESLRSLTEKLRAVSHTLVMGIQSRWCRNGYDGRSTTSLPVGVLQVVVELITSAKGLFTLLNRFGGEGYLTVVRHRHFKSVSSGRKELCPVSQKGPPINGGISAKSVRDSM